CHPMAARIKSLGITGDSRVATSRDQPESSFVCFMESWPGLKWRGSMIIRILWRKNVLLLGLITALVLGVSVYGQDRDDYGGRWGYLGRRHVDGHPDHDVGRGGMRGGKFRAVQLRVRGGAVDFHRVVVHFGNGTSEEIAYRERIPDGGRTRA